MKATFSYLFFVLTSMPRTIGSCLFTINSIVGSFECHPAALASSINSTVSYPSFFLLL
nr:MAG TPA: hypothetical protein [Caudoviricetes sp.]